jgi:Right handed beta helix region
MDYCYGNEIRDSYVHDGRSSASGANYGIYLQFVNTDAKIENNIMRHNRHGFVFQGGGDGVVFLYNYIDDLYTDDLTYLGSARTSHGAHPYMNLFEGNVASHIAGDDFWGTSSHDVFFRNWIWGDETGNGVPSFPPEEGFDAIDLYTGQAYYSYVGNMLGLPASNAIPTAVNGKCQVTSTMNPHTTWSAATGSGFNEYASATNPIVYSYGGSLAGAASSADTVVRNGNYDYHTLGVAYWDDGSTNNPIGKSYYYSSMPSFFGECAWPVAGPDLTPMTNVLPAEACYLNGPAAGKPFTPASCY